MLKRKNLLMFVLSLVEEMEVNFDEVSAYCCILVFIATYKISQQQTFITVHTLSLTGIFCNFIQLYFVQPM